MRPRSSGAAAGGGNIEDNNVNTIGRNNIAANINITTGINININVINIGINNNNINIVTNDIGINTNTSTTGIVTDTTSEAGGTWPYGPVTSKRWGPTLLLVGVLHTTSTRW